MNDTNETTITQQQLQQQQRQHHQSQQQQATTTATISTHARLIGFKITRVYASQETTVDVSSGGAHVAQSRVVCPVLPCAVNRSSRRVGHHGRPRTAANNEVRRRPRASHRLSKGLVACIGSEVGAQGAVLGAA
jgi:hypothetical protein